MSVDPLAHKLPGYSPYAYTLNNPINMVDPDGRYPWPIDKWKSQVSNYFNSFFGTSIPVSGVSSSTPVQHYDVKLRGSVKVDLGLQAGVEASAKGLEGKATLDGGSFKMLELGFDGTEAIGDIGGDGNTTEFEMGAGLGLSHKKTKTGLGVGVKRQYSEYGGKIIEGTDKNVFSGTASILGQGINVNQKKGFSDKELSETNIGVKAAASVLIGVEAKLELNIKPVPPPKNQE